MRASRPTLSHCYTDGLLSPTAVHMLMRASRPTLSLTTLFVSSYCICVLALLFRVPAQVGDICYYVCALILPSSVLMLLHVRHHKRRRDLQRYVQALLLYVSSDYYICVLVQAGVMCSDTCKCVDCRNTCAKV